LIAQGLATADDLEVLTQEEDKRLEKIFAQVLAEIKQL
jgi:hypothetical protein